MSFRFVPKSVTLNGLEQNNCPYFPLYLTDFVYDVVIKQLLGLHRFHNLLLMVCDHINSTWGGLDGRVHFNDGEFSSGLITRFDGRRCLISIIVIRKWLAD